MNDIVEKLFFVKISTYADDCVVYMSGNNWESIRTKIQEDLDIFEYWGELNNLHLNVSKTKMLLVGNRTKVQRLGLTQPLELYNRNIPFVKSYIYLGVILDTEMTLRPFYNHVRKITYSKIFNLIKICNYVTEFAAIMIYKYTILLYLEYAGFLLTACSVDEKRELQKCQNDALCICTRVRLLDHVRIDVLHDKCKIASLEQRRRVQLLLLMYKKSKDVFLHKVFPRNTRRSNRIVFKTDSYEGTLYKRSPYFVGTKLWNELKMETITLPDIYSFKTSIKTGS